MTLTPAQQRVMAAIIARYRVDRRTLSVRTLAADLGVAHSNVWRILRCLHDRDMICLVNGRPVLAGRALYFRMTKTGPAGDEVESVSAAPADSLKVVDVFRHRRMGCT